jgi:hypothetical protein
MLGCAGSAPRSKQAKRAHALMARDRAVASAEESKQDMTPVDKAAGYAVIASAMEMPYELPAGYGFGVIHDQSSGTNTFFLAVRQGPQANDPMPTFLLVFDTKKSLLRFTDEALAAKAKAPASIALDEGGEIYELLEAGGVGRGATSDLRYWYDKDVGG